MWDSAQRREEEKKRREKEREKEIKDLKNEIARLQHLKKERTSVRKVG